MFKSTLKLLSFCSLLLLLTFVVSTELKTQECTVTAGELSLAIDQNYIVFCGDDEIPDTLTVYLEGNTEVGSWLVTTTYGVILEELEGPPFDFSGYEDGTYFIFYLVTGEPFTGNVDIGDNVCTLTPNEGCWSLSNYIRVTIVSGEDCEQPCEAEAGSISFTGGELQAFVCVDGIEDAIEVVLNGPANASSFSFVITDLEGNILAIPEDNGPFDFELFNVATVLVYYIAMEEELEGFEVDGHLDDLEGCFVLSNPLSVFRQSPNGGVLEGGPFSFCVGDGASDFIPEGAISVTAATGSNFAWVVTDTAGNILGLPEDYSSVDFEGSGNGICLVWHLAFEDGLEGAIEGSNANDLVGCFSLSNPIEVIRNDPNIGSIAWEDTVDVYEICLGDSIADGFFITLVNDEPTIAEGMSCFLTNEGDTIVGFTDDPDIFNTLEPGNYRVYCLALFGAITNFEIGISIESLQGCFDLSNNFLSMQILSDEECNPPTPLVPGILREDFENVCLEGQLGPPIFPQVLNFMELDNYAIVISNAITGEIIVVEDLTSVFEFETHGMFGLFYANVISYNPANFSGLVVGGNLSDLSGDFIYGENFTQINISNANSTCVDAYNYCENVVGNIQFEEPDQELCFCVEDGLPDLVTIELVNPEDFVGEALQLVLLNGPEVVAIADENNTFDFEGLEPAESLTISAFSINGGLLEVGDIITELDFSICYANSGFAALSGILLLGNDDCGNGLTITEIDNDGTIELTNFSNKFVGVNSYVLANNNEYFALADLAVECGDLSLSPNEIVVLRKAGGFNMIGDELALFTSEDEVGNHEKLLDYVRWGGGSFNYIAEAIMAGQWTNAMNLPNPMDGETLQLITDAEENEVWQIAIPSPCELNNPSGVFDMAENLDFEVFPNPIIGSQSLNLKLDHVDYSNLTLEIFDQNGRQVKANWHRTASNCLQVNLAEMPGGIYFLRLTNGSVNLTDRFIIQR